MAHPPRSYVNIIFNSVAHPPRSCLRLSWLVGWVDGTRRSRRVGPMDLTTDPTPHPHPPPQKNITPTPPPTGHVTKRLSVMGVLILSLCSYILRFLIYASIRNPWQGLPAEALRGFTFAAMWASSTYYTHRISPPGLSATMVCACVAWRALTWVGSRGWSV